MSGVIIGLGCDRHASLDTVRGAVDQALALAGVDPAAVIAVATIDKKSDEAAIVALAVERGWALHFFGAEALACVAVPSPSETVRRYMGTPSVAEAAALLAAGAGMDALILEKHKHRGGDGRHATVSITRRTSA